MKELLAELEKLQVEANKNSRSAYEAGQSDSENFENGRHAAFTEVIHLVKRMSTSDADYGTILTKGWLTP